MRIKKINSIIQEVLENKKPKKEEVNKIEDYTKRFVEKLKAKIKILKINVEVFIGGSFAKKTVIKKESYDVDIFLRFDKKYKNDNMKYTTR